MDSPPSRPLATTRPCSWKAASLAAFSSSERPAVGVAVCGPLVVGELDAGAQEGRERHVERQVHAQTDHHGRNAEPVHDDAGDKATCEPRHARDARDHGGDHACLRGHKALVGAKGVRTIGGDERDHDGGGDQGAHDAADGLADPLRARVGAQHGAGLKVVHDVARKAARHGHDAGDKEQLDLSDLCERQPR